jgi:thioredoxin-related protein
VIRFVARPAAVLFTAAIVIFGAVHAASGGAAQSGVPLVRNLQADALTARNLQLPVLLEFAAEYCSYCELLEEEVIEPMIISGDYTDKVIIRKVLIDGSSLVRDFDGVLSDPVGLAGRYGVSATPTLVFVDHDGRELAPRIVGVNTIELFGGRVDDAIEQSLAVLRKGAAVTAEAAAPDPSGV